MVLKPNFVTKKTDSGKTYSEFVLTPLPAGFGHSLGNALRRALLSSIEGAAVTFVKINDVVHPFTTLEGVKESGLDMILNLKALRFKVSGQGPFTMSLSKKGKGEIKASELEGGNVEVVNKDQHIAELTSPKAKLDIEITIEKGLGYSPSEEKEKQPFGVLAVDSVFSPVTSPKAKLDIEITIEKGLGYSPSEEKEKQPFGVLAVDSVFSPVTKVVYRIEDERVGRKTNFDKLTLEVWTDGTVQPDEAVHQAAQLLGEYFSYILSGKDEENAQEVGGNQADGESKEIDDKVYEIIIDELDLPTRVINALLREKIETVGDLVSRGRSSLVNLKGVGRKSITLIESELEKLGIQLEGE